MKVESVMPILFILLSLTGCANDLSKRLQAVENNINTLNRRQASFERQFDRHLEEHDAIFRQYQTKTDQHNDWIINNYRSIETIRNEIIRAQEVTNRLEFVPVGEGVEIIRVKPVRNN